ncbi:MULTISPECIES: TetR/AcrR family transcriptional regulator [Hoeflea]|uniref:TetR family transcriptional regulator n=1 Tax=Hoeflea alexandrii TaxID=288436 RepID=A0ABT1CS51_9HYPH|nr:MULTISPECIES: TetR/AcrR family transcriptional regulator [Hoeflea]MCO6409035.1 TetR family transcriptional regulator [Hoeflea alexandrii]VVT29770.1 TetR family transcriptional regulator [Hoeflea sp. EC-HK425]
MSKAELKRQFILKQTEALLVREGGAGLSMRKVADACGMSLGNLQYHYATREALLEALLASFIANYVTLVRDRSFQPTGDLQKDLSAILSSGLELLDKTEASRVFKELWAAAQQSDSLAAEMTAYYRELARFYAQTLRSLDQTAGDDNINRAVSVLMPLFEGYCVTRSALPQDRRELAEIWARAISATLDAAE